MNPWQYNEHLQVGADFADTRRAAAYDKRMQKVRNPLKRAKEMGDLLDLRENDTLLDMGCGTGTITLELAKKCHHVIGVDISAAMLKIAEDKAISQNIGNVHFTLGGFLTYNHGAEPVDKILTAVALHHLPDFWKAIALQRLHAMLRDGGLLLLSDVIFAFEPKAYQEEIDIFLQGILNKADEAQYKDSLLHIKEEFSTFDWLMDEMLKHTGFEIVQKVVKTKTYIDYLCKKS